jgi:hypothetical protein
MLYKCENTISRRMKRFQVRENNIQQIMAKCPQRPSKNSRNMALYNPLNMILHGVSSTSNVLPT